MKPTTGRRKREPEARAPQGWLLLIHQVPPQPPYLRVKVWRRLNAIGAVALKNTVYVLPQRDDTLEDFQWLRREIVGEGGEATVCVARFIDGLSEGEAVGLFNAARDADYAALVEEIRRARAEQPQAGEELAGRFRRRLDEIVARDFFGAPGLQVARDTLAGLTVPRPDPPSSTGTPALPQRAVWVTRRAVEVDRIASAWLIRRFVDPAARFKFVEADYAPRKGEVRFDMFEAEFTHEGDRCTFEVLLARAKLDDPALTAIAEIVHDIDLKDGKFRRPEAAGLAIVLAGIAASSGDDDERLARGAQLLDDLHRQLTPGAGPRPRRKAK